MKEKQKQHENYPKNVNKKCVLKKPLSSRFIKENASILKKAHTKVTAAMKKENLKQQLVNELLQKRKSDLSIRERKKINRSVIYKKIISFDVLRKSIDFLNDKVNGDVKFPEKCKRKIHHLKNSCFTEQYAVNSFTTICAEMHKCLLLHDWTNVTKCILALLDGPLVLQPVVWKAAIINLLHNPHARNSGLMEDFLRMCISCQTEADMETFLHKIFTLPKEKVVQNPRGLMRKLLQKSTLTEIAPFE